MSVGSCSRTRRFAREKVSAELFEIESHREVRTFGRDDEDAHILVRGDGRSGEGKVAPEGAAESVSRVGTI